MTETACDLCGSEETTPRLRSEEWQLVRCNRCSLVYLNPRPDPEVIERDYDWFRHQPIQAGARSSAPRSALRNLRNKMKVLRKVREQKVLDRIKQFVKGGRLLDVGCGTGSVAVASNDAGFEGYGLDISDIAIDIAKSHGLENMRKGTIHDTDYPDAHFDALLMMSVLEHEHFPTRALEAAHRLLKSGGHLFIKVPNYACWNRVVTGKHWCGYYFPQHLFQYTPKTLAALVEKAKFTVVSNGFWDHMPLSDVFWLAARKPQRVARA